MQISIRLLGNTELYVDGRIATPSAAKRRAVLAGLAMEANRPVSLSRLAGMVWGDASPASAVANLRSHAAALRHALGDRLIARPVAYELRLSPHEVDVDEFQRLAAAGRADLPAGDAVAAIGKLTGALGLWRGPAGEGLPCGTALDNHWASLEEQRRQVFEELAQARLAAGEHADLLPELRRHLAAHPLRERAWGQLMLALYRCGDVPAALTAYRDAHAALREQLGIDPGEELGALHRAMLDRAPELAYADELPVVRTTDRVPTAGSAAEAAESGAGVPVPIPVVPRELPADLVAFVGRTAEVAELVGAVTGATPAAVVVSGPPGSGKTALAVRAAHEVSAEFPDGQVFVDVASQPSVTAEEVLGRVLRALGLPAAEVPAGGDERAGWYRSRVAGRRILLVLDGVTGAEQVRPLIPAGAGPALIVVGQRHLHSLDGVRRVALAPVGAAGARSLLAALTGTERLEADPAATAELVRHCAGSVLALKVTGSRLASRPQLPVAALAEQLRDRRDRLDLLAFGHLSVRASLAVNVAAARAADELAGRLLELLGESPDAVAAPDRTAARLGVSTRRVWQALEDLVDAHLVHRDEPGGYRLSALVRDYAVELAAMPSVTQHPGWRAGSAAA
ncbi:BTAD domain-containing putative transcriptional regulator [Micromonospora echinaurantiaca]|uniref:AfsR/SARP family transcriptional regulator n=1 Tax=Micromonospora echinaurantiaca TaxID=47857 RepID=UPI0037988FA9